MFLLNDNYTFTPMTEDEKARETHLQYDKPTVVETVNNDSVNDTNVSTSCADKVTVQDGHAQNKNNSSFAENDSKTCDDDTPTVEKFNPQKYNVHVFVIVEVP